MEKYLEALPVKIELAKVATPLGNEWLKSYFFKMRKSYFQYDYN